MQIMGSFCTKHRQKQNDFQSDEQTHISIAPSLLHQRLCSATQLQRLREEHTAQLEEMEALHRRGLLTLGRDRDARHSEELARRERAYEAQVGPGLLSGGFAAPPPAL